MADGIERFHEYPLAAALTAPNPGPKTLTGTRTYIVGRAPAYIVDPGPASAEHHAAIRGALDRLDAEPAAILLSHSHPDHAPGAAQVAADLRIPVWASPRLPASRAVALGVTQRYADDQEFPLEGDLLHVIATPGHAWDHVAFWLPATRLLFTGDTILGEGTSLVAPPEGNMAAYMATLDGFRRLEPAIIAPGHGPLVRDPLATLAAYVAHREQREREILAALSHGPADIPILVERIYSGLAPALRDLAHLSVAAQLDKLIAEQRVRRVGDTYQAVGPIH